MTSRSAGTAPPPARDARDTDRELLARLGLGERAGNRDVEAAHDAIVAFLEAAPPDIAAWARDAQGAADEAYALLADPTSRAASSPVEGTAPTGAPDAVADGGGDRTPGLLWRIRHEPRTRRIAIAAAAVALGIAVVGVYKIGGGNRPPARAQADASATPASARVDTQRVAELKRAIAKDPRGVTPLIRLGDLYFQAGDYASAATWMGRAVKLRPANTTARLALGASWFNMGRKTDAKREWTRVVATNPRNVEAHYDLGFLYLSANPPDTARVRAEWGRVVALAPKSQVAKTVAAHLAQLGKISSAGAK